MGKTNSLTSHHPERKSFDAEKSVPKEHLKIYTGNKKSAGRKTIKKLHRRKARQYSKQKIKKELDGE